MGSCEYNSLRPVVLIGVTLMFLKPIKDALTVFPGTSLTNIDYTLACLVRCTEQEMNSALFQVIAVFALIQLCARNSKGNTSPICQSTFDSSTGFAIHQEKLYVFSACRHSMLLQLVQICYQHHFKLSMAC